MSVRHLLPVATLLLGLAPATGMAQAGRSDADTREILAYRLTMPKLRQLNDVYAELLREQESDPAYRELMKKKRELAALEQKEELSDAELERMTQLQDEIERMESEEYDPAAEDEDTTLDGIVARMEAEPRLVAAFKRAGLSLREGIVMQLALLQAGFAAELLASGTITEIPKEVSTENVKFYQANKAAIAALTALAQQD